MNLIIPSDDGVIDLHYDVAPPFHAMKSMNNHNTQVVTNTTTL